MYMSKLLFVHLYNRENTVICENEVEKNDTLIWNLWFAFEPNQLYIRVFLKLTYLSVMAEMSILIGIVILSLQRFENGNFLYYFESNFILQYSDFLEKEIILGISVSIFFAKYNRNFTREILNLILSNVLKC